MRLKAQFLAGIFFAISVTSWGVLVWYRFSIEVGWFFVPLMIGMILAIAILAFDE